ncbi:hypothetical protein QKQ66_gp044 [Dione juno nucleopolyhedrovirus]|uniref:Uncharacterized protein n=1 Tax=Dione juno nucleopolyhedrovirus TaxID=2594175 RepID=A0AAE6LC48_9ABAC|nr:hypothetical protein QKQ66_gp044 [Dione juno nucleopolyhedrovirus]QDL56950.1 hypothetical protein DijuNPV-ORF-44 [Dione juno nucleopolyhedrovirus]
MKLLQLLVVALTTLVVVAFAKNALPDPLAPPSQHAGHLAGAPKSRSRGLVYNAAEQKLQQCRAHLNN